MKQQGLKLSLVATCGALTVAVLSIRVFADVPAAVLAEPPKDEKSFADFFSKRLAEGLPDFSIQLVDPRTMRVTSKSGAQIDDDIGYVRAMCFNENSWSDCINDTIRSHIGMLRPPQNKDFRVRLTKMIGGPLTNVALRAARFWATPAFGGFQAECYKNGPEFAFPLTAWDGKVLGIDYHDTGKLCEDGTREALGALASKPVIPAPDGIGTRTGPLEASRAWLIEEWQPLADKMQGGLLVAIPNSNTILFADGQTPGVAARLSERASQMRTTAQPYEQLSTDVYRWTKDGWQLVTSHAIADQVVAALQARFGEYKFYVVDAALITVVVPKGEIVDFRLGELSSCKGNCQAAIQHRIEQIADVIEKNKVVMSQPGKIP